MRVLKSNQAYLSSISNVMPGEFYPAHVIEYAKTSKGFMTILEWSDSKVWEVEQ